MMPNLIERPKLQPVWMRVFYFCLTLAMWCLWVFLLIPLISLIPAMEAIEFFDRHSYFHVDKEQLVQLLAFCAIACLAIACCVVGWSKINQKKFGQHNRRINTTTASKLSDMEFFEISEGDLDRCKSAKYIYCHFDENGKVSFKTSKVSRLPPNQEEAHYHVAPSCQQNTA